VIWTSEPFQSVIPSPKYSRAERLALQHLAGLDLDLADARRPFSPVPS
jgi:hypothetical protein